MDPRLVVAIAGAESSLGTNGLCATQRHNAWGYGGGWPNCWNFGTWNDAINQVAWQLNDYIFNRGLTTIHAIGHGGVALDVQTGSPMFGNSIECNFEVVDRPATPRPTPQPTSLPPTPAPKGATLYENVDFTGRSLRVVQDQPNLHDQNFGDTASAIRVDDDMHAILFENINYDGSCQLFSTGQHSLVGTWIGNDSTSSVKVGSGPGPVDTHAIDGWWDSPVVPTNGIFHTAGWARDDGGGPCPGIYDVRLFVDGNYAANASYGDWRGDLIGHYGWHIDYNIPSSLGDGAHEFWFKFRDRGGDEYNDPVHTRLTIKVDRTAPTNPTLATETDCSAADGQWTRCGTPSFTWQGAADSNSGVAGYYVYFGGDANGFSQDFRACNPQTCSSFTYTPPPVGTGTYYLRVKTADQAGNQADWKTLFTFRSDQRPPQNPTFAVEQSGVGNDAWQNRVPAPNFSWAGAHDDESGIAGYRIYWGTDPAGTAETLYTTGNAIPLNSVCDGECWSVHYLRVSTRDRVGNDTGWITLFTLRYDGAKPVGSLVINDDQSLTYATQVELTLNASDQGSGLAQMSFRNHLPSIGVQDWSAWGLYATRKVWTLPPINRTEPGVEGRVSDLAGNVSDPFTDTIRLEVQPPRPASDRFIIVAAERPAGGTLATSSRFQVQSSSGQPIAPPLNAPIRQGITVELASSFQAAFLAPYNTPTPTPTPTLPPPPTPTPPPTPVPSYDVTINDGALYTYNTNVTLRLIAPWDTRRLKVSNDGGFLGTEWQPYVPQMKWTIEPYLDHVITCIVYVKYETASGEIVRQDNIILDPVEPRSFFQSASVSRSSSRSPLATSDLASVLMEWGGNDGGEELRSGVWHYNIMVMDEADGQWKPWLVQTEQTSAEYQGSPGHTVEAWQLGDNPDFLALIERSRARHNQEGGIPLQEVRRRLGLTGSG